MPKKQWIDFAKVRAALTFDDVFAHYDLAPPDQKTQTKINCPFHDDATPSCSINREKQIFRCFGCNESGNALEFISLMESGAKDDPADMYQAAALAVDMMGRDLSEFGKDSKGPETPKPARREAKQPKTRKTAAKASKAADGSPAASGEPPTPEPNPAIDIELKLDPEHSFLADRGITPELATRYGLGYCDKGIMRGRIAIPIHNLAGELVAYAGRYASDELPENTERYRFPKKFRKSLELWNIHRAAAFFKRHLTLVESYWSAIRLQEAGIPAAALMGTSLSVEQAKLVREAGFKLATLLLDGDDAGREAAIAAAPILAEHVYTRILPLPDGVKPDDMPERFLKRLT